MHKSNKISNTLIMTTRHLLITACINAVFSAALMAENVFSQDLEKCHVTITVKEKAITDIFKLIENQTVYKFSYDKQVESIEGITIHAENTSLLKVLKKLEQQAFIVYKKFNNMIVVVWGSEKSVGHKISAVEIPAAESNCLANAFRLRFAVLPVKGRVTDENGQPLPGVNILEKERL